MGSQVSTDFWYLYGSSSICLFFVFQSCDIKAEGRKRFLTLKNVQLDQAGEVSYQALNAVTSAMLSVKGTNLMNKPAFCCLVEAAVFVGL